MTDSMLRDSVRSERLVERVKLVGCRQAKRIADRLMINLSPVSYTHLTLPTICSV